MAKSHFDYFNKCKEQGNFKPSKSKNRRAPQRQAEQRNAVSNLFDKFVKMNGETSTAKINRLKERSYCSGSYGVMISHASKG